MNKYLIITGDIKLGKSKFHLYHDKDVLAVDKKTAKQVLKITGEIFTEINKIEDEINYTSCDGYQYWDN